MAETKAQLRQRVQYSEEVIFGRAVDMIRDADKYEAERGALDHMTMYSLGAATAWIGALYILTGEPQDSIRARAEQVARAKVAA